MWCYMAVPSHDAVGFNQAGSTEVLRQYACDGYIYQDKDSS